MRYFSEIFWTHFQDIFGLLSNHFEFFVDIPEMFVHFLWILTNLLYVCKSVSWLSILLKLGWYRDISSSRWDIFLKSFGDIPGMLVHYFQTLLNFLYVCQSVIWLTFLLMLDKYRDICSSGWYIFLKFCGNIPWIFLH